MNGKKKRYLSVAILMTAMLMAPGAAFGHGYVEQQPSRALLCAQGVNKIVAEFSMNHNQPKQQKVFLKQV